VNVWVHIIHVNFKLGPKIGLHIVHKYMLYSKFYGTMNATWPVCNAGTTKLLCALRC